MITADQSRSAKDLEFELESLIALLDHIDFGARIKSWRERPIHSAIRPRYKAKTYNQKNVTVEDERIISLSVFAYEINLSKTFDPKKHFKQFQQFSYTKTGQVEWHDYALLLLTDNTVGLLNLTSNELVSTVTVSLSVDEIHIEMFNDSLQRVRPLIERGRDILGILNHDDATAPEYLETIVAHLGRAHESLLFRTGNVGFFSGTSGLPDSIQQPETQLGRFDLSKASKGIFEEIRIEPAMYLNSEIPLHDAVIMELSTESEFTVLEKVRRNFYKSPWFDLDHERLRRDCTLPASLA